MPSNNEEPETIQNSPELRFDPDDRKVEEPEPRIGLDEDKDTDGVGARAMRNPAQDVEDEELAEEDILEQRDLDVDDAAKGEGPDA